MRTVEVSHAVYILIMFPGMGEITVISNVFQLLKTISDGNLLVSRRCSMLVGSLKIFIQLKLYL